MNISIAESLDEKERIQELLKENIPCHEHSYYNDITAWRMACLSHLVYIKFNTPPQPYSSEDKRLEKLLKILNMKREKTFDEDGSQAILVSSIDSSKKFIALAFRGTERDSMRDIKRNAKAAMMTEEEGNIHKGFKTGFEAVCLEIEEYLAKGKENEEAIQNWPLFITGHSLGGALATIAAKKLRTRGGIATCYTFGSPRVGDDKWITGIESPIYRIVNSADFVPNLPPGTTFWTIVCGIVKRLPYFGKPMRAWLAKYGGYLHCGDMRYLTNCAKGSYHNVELLYYISWWQRIIRFWVGKLPFKNIITDHKIKVYLQKLMVLAERKRGRDIEEAIKKAVKDAKKANETAQSAKEKAQTAKEKAQSAKKENEKAQAAKEADQAAKEADQAAKEAAQAAKDANEATKAAKEAEQAAEDAAQAAEDAAKYAKEAKDAKDW